MFLQANFTNCKLQNSDWTHALIGEYPSLSLESEAKAVATHGAIIVNGCEDGNVRVWQDEQVPTYVHLWMYSCLIASGVA